LNKHQQSSDRANSLGSNSSKTRAVLVSFAVQASKTTKSTKRKEQVSVTLMFKMQFATRSQ
jgi:hypothetical protein